MDSEYALNLLLNYSSVRNTGSMGNLNLTPSSLSTRNTSVQGVMPMPITVPRPNDVLTLPQYIPQVNKWNDNAPYKLFVDTMLGHLNPKLKFAQPKHHSGCVEMIVLTAIAVVASVVAPEIVLAVAPAIAGSLAGAALTGVVAGLIDAGFQGVAVGLGAVRHFSLEAAADVALGRKNVLWENTHANFT